MATEDARKLFVAGLPESITEDALRQIFEATGGKVMEVSLPRDRATGRIRGFGFVTFSAPEEAAAARDTLDGSLQAGRPISVRPFSSEPPRREARGDVREGGDRPPPGPPQPDDRTLYVGNLPYDTSQQEVTQLFSDNGLGPVVRIHLPTGPDGRLRGFGFVTLQSADAANQALNTLRTLDVRGRRLMVNIAHPRGERPAGAGPRPPREGGGGWGGEPRPGGFASEAPLTDFRSSAPDARRGRFPGPSGGPPGGGGGGSDWSEEARKKKKKGGGKGGGAADRGRRERGGGGRQSWDDDLDDD